MYNDNNKFVSSINPRVKIMLKIIHDLKLRKKNVLDIGCHDGTLLIHINKNNSVHGIEASDYGVKTCRKKGIRMKQMFIEDTSVLPYKNRFFDLVIMGEVIEHMFDTDHLLEEISRILKPGGKLLITTPNIASFGRRLLLLVGKNPLMELSPNEPQSTGHIRYFTFTIMESLLKKHGFRIVKKLSDVVNFSNDGKHRSDLFAKLIPSLGQSIIMLCEKSN